MHNYIIKIAATRVTARSHAPAGKKIDLAADGKLGYMVGKKVYQSTFGFVMPETASHHFTDIALFTNRVLIRTKSEKSRFGFVG